MNTFVALLRGINVGGTAKVAMGQLRSLYSSLGHQDVATYVQSGNVVFRCAADDEQEVAASIERRIAETFAI